MPNADFVFESFGFTFKKDKKNLTPFRQIKAINFLGEQLTGCFDLSPKTLH
jgi:hypothetical protein